MMSQLDVRGAIALIIVLTLGITIVTIVVGAVVTGRALSEHGAHALSTTVGALIGVLSVYIGGKASEPPKP